MVKHRDVVDAWLGQAKLKGSRMFTDGKVIYSYGEHWPLALWVGSNRILLNVENYGSPSTSKHLSYVRSGIPSHIEVIECNCSEIQRVINYPEEPIVIKQKVEPDDLGEILALLKKYFKAKGIKRYPSKKVEDWFTEQFVAKLV